jgi:hypothetical protein
VNPLVDIIVSFSFSVSCVTLMAMVFIVLRRTRRGEKVSTDEDWRLLFGKPKAEVLSLHYGVKLCFGFILCLLLGIVEYVIIFPYGLAWYGAGLVATTFVIMLLTAKGLR